MANDPQMNRPDQLSTSQPVLPNPSHNTACVPAGDKILNVRDCLCFEDMPKLVK